MKTQANNPWAAHWPAIIWSLLVALLLLLPGGSAPPGPPWLDRFGAAGGDKLIHALLFLAHAALVARSGRRLGLGDAPGWAAAGVAILYGLALEVAQDAIPGRGWEAGDLVADAAGALLWPLTSRLRRV